MPAKKKKIDREFEQAKKNVLWEWRGFDEEEYERMHAISEKSVSELIPQVFEKIKFEERLKQAEILNVWNSAISSDVRNHAQPFGLKDGKLIIEVDSNVWLAELCQFRKQEILNRLQAAFGSECIKDIIFRLA